MITELKNKCLSIQIHSKGAELCSVKNEAGLQFLWQADAQVWPRHAPVLFPIVGRLKNDSYTFQEKVFHLSQHGFARDCEFELIKQTETTAVFELLAGEASKKQFPFDFSFQITYTLIESGLEIAYHVLNKDTAPMYFSVGAHPGFRCPLLPNESMADYYLQFEADEYNRTVLDGGLRSPNKETYYIPNKKLAIHSHLFDADALVFEGGQISRIALRSVKNTHAIEMECTNWPYFGIWSKKGSEAFICLEPWMGIADSTESTGKLEEKTGIICLQANTSFHCSYSIHFK